jgi:hypothetical protein
MKKNRVGKSNPPAKKKISRREALKILGQGSLAVSFFPLWSCSTGTLRNLGSTPQAPSLPPLAKISPMQRDLGEIAPRGFSGDDPKVPHSVLWAKEEFLRSKGGLPQPTERAELVIVGGGMSGLFSAWLLNEHKPILLEQASRFGGNSRGESWRGVDYSIGAAYFTKHDEFSEIYGLFQELGLYEISREKDTEDPVCLGKEWHNAFWDGTTDPKRAKEFKKLARHFIAISDSKDGLLYPEIPWTDEKMRAYVQKLDRQSFLTYVQKVNGGPLHPHIATALEHYCWSALGAGMKDLSAAVALNFFAAEFGTLMVAPGGNGRLAEEILKKLANQLPRENLRESSTVVDVRLQGETTLVTYLNAAGELRSIEAKACVLACPKFVVGKILHGMEADRAAVIQELKYHPYLIANVCLKKKLSVDVYNAFLLKDGKVQVQDVAGSAKRHKTTDMVFANYGADASDHTVLTLYRPLPWQGARAEIYADSAFETIHKEFSEELPQILELLGVKPEEVADLRIARWGHPLPIAAPGLLRSGKLEILQRTFQDRVFFVEQDNWMLPSIETCATEALRVAPLVQELLQPVS